MKFPNIQAFGIGIGLFLAVYVPAFIVTGLVRPHVEVAIPLIIGITFLSALIMIYVFARAPSDAAEFGFTIADGRYLFLATAVGLVLGIAVTFVCHLFPSKPPLDLSHLRPWMTALYFVVGAPIQEEVIFRGLIQSMLERRWTSRFSMSSGSLSRAVVFTAVLFGIIHLEVGAVVAIGAIILGLAAGELRRRSGSLLPAIIVHALFNAADTLWPKIKM